MKVLLIKDGKVNQKEISCSDEANELQGKGFIVVRIGQEQPTQFAKGDWYGINTFVKPEMLMSKGDVKKANIGMASLVATLSKCENFKDWHAHWISFDGTFYRAWEPDNTCIYTGNSPDCACKALSNSGFSG